MLSTTVEYLLYGLDLLPCDNRLLGPGMEGLEGRRFENDDAMMIRKYFQVTWLQTSSSTFYDVAAIKKLSIRLQKCVKI